MSLQKRYEISPAVQKAIDKDNQRFSIYLLIIYAAIGVAFVAWNALDVLIRHVRTLACMNNDSQRFFKRPQSSFARLQKYLLDAPLIRHRHSHRLRLGKIEGNTIPTRFQSLILLAIVAANIAFTAYGIEWNGVHTTLLQHLRNRTGVLSVTNMILLVLLSGRNNPVIKVTGLPYATSNLVHRWLGNIVIILVAIHGSLELSYFKILAQKMHVSSSQAFTMFMTEATFLMWGFIAFLAMLCIFLTTFTTFRHAFYETFLHIHIALAALILAALWYHLAEQTYAMTLLKVIIAIWIIERAIRLLSLLYRNIGRTGTHALVESLPGDAMRITLRIARPWRFKPGQHVYLTMPTVGLWTSHPFSVVWQEGVPRAADPEKGLARQQNESASSIAITSTSFCLLVRRRGGFTDRLYGKCAKSSTGRISLPALIEGPYGHSNDLHSYGTVMFFAGGVGITHSVPYIRDLVESYTTGTAAVRRVLLVWVIKSPEHLEWIRPWMTTVLAMHKRRDVLRIQLFVSRPRNTKEIYSPSSTLQMFHGKPNVDSLVEMESRDQVGAMGVSVCGPGSLADDVRAAVRKRQQQRNIDLIEESYGW